MQRYFAFLPLWISACFLLPAIAASQTPSLVKAINPGSEWSFLEDPVNFNGTLYFGADDGTNGNELWKSNGTEEGTVLTCDINPGSDGSYPDELTVVNGTLYFPAYNGTTGEELWKLSGTMCSLVRDIASGFNDSEPSQLVNVSGTLLFGADDGSSGRELWKSDGTAVGTVQVCDINPGSGSGLGWDTWKRAAVVNGTLFFAADDGTSGFELWKSDGTTCSRVEDINPGSGSSDPDQLADVNGTLFFAADDGAGGTELWNSDGTSLGTTIVCNIGPGSASSDPQHLTNVGGTLFFAADDGTNGRELWTSNGTACSLVLDINPGPGSSVADWRGRVCGDGFSMADLAGSAFVLADDGTHGCEPWISDGTAGGTKLLRDINEGSAESVGSEDFGIVVGNHVYFSPDDGTLGSELWKCNGKTCWLVDDIDPGANGSDPIEFALVGPTLFFGAATATTGDGLWKLAPPKVPLVSRSGKIALVLVLAAAAAWAAREEMLPPPA